MLLEVLAVQFRDIVWELTPVADNGSLPGEFEALLTIVTLPVTLPVICGAKVTLKEALCPTAKVNGTARPVTLNPVPVTPAWEMVRLLLPVFLSETGRVLLLPTITFPKFVEAGESVNAAPRPLPLRETTAGLFEELLTIEILPLAVPADFGAKVTLKDALWPGASVRGRVSPPTVKPVPVTEACEIVTLAVPVSVRVTV